MEFADRKYWGIVRELAVCHFKLKDQSTFFGFLWSFLHPLFILVVLFAFFRTRMGKDIHHYAFYLLIGIVHFTHFSNCTSASMGVLQGMKQITANAILPKEILVIASVVANTIEFVLSLLIAIPIGYFAGVQLSWTVSMLPFVVMLQFLTVLWISIVLSSLFVLVRDIGHIYQVFLRLMFFTTPIFYTHDFLGDGIARYIVSFNPLSHLMNYSRFILLEGRPLPAFSFGLFLLLSLVLVAASFKFFKYYEPRYAELV